MNVPPNAHEEEVRIAVVEFAQELVREISPSRHEAIAASLVKQKMESLGYFRTMVDAFGNVVGQLASRCRGPTVLLASHLDVVVPMDPEREGGTGRVENGLLYGPGAADCKGGLAAQVFAGAELLRSALLLEGNVVVAATVAEENGCALGMRQLMEQTLPQLGLRPDFVVLGEPTSLGLCYGADGWFEFDICVESADAPELARATQVIDQELKLANGRNPGTDAKQYLTVRLIRTEKVGELTRTVMGVTRRLEPTEDVEDVLHQTSHAIALATQAYQVELELVLREETQRLYTGGRAVVRHVVRPWSIKPHDFLVEQAKVALSKRGDTVRPTRWRLSRLGMGGAGGVLVNEFGIPTIGYGPGDETEAHRPGEWVDVQKLIHAVYGTAAIAEGLIGVPKVGGVDGE
jgi:acetylornithine deacetylase/succinyl-diaminopimelate desuccinylase-like protein